MADASGLSIVVVSWRSEATLPALDPLHRAHLGAEPEIVVVENDPGSGDSLPGLPGELRRVEPERSLGYGAACNAGVAAATRPAVAMLNPDCELADPGLTALAAGGAPPPRARRAAAPEPRRLGPALRQRTPGGSLALGRGRASGSPAARLDAGPH